MLEVAMAEWGVSWYEIETKWTTNQFFLMLYRMMERRKAQAEMMATPAVPARPASSPGAAALTTEALKSHGKFKKSYPNLRSNKTKAQ